MKGDLVKKLMKVNIFYALPPKPHHLGSTELLINQTLSTTSSLSLILVARSMLEERELHTLMT